jgi:GAF domain-containing protein
VRRLGTVNGEPDTQARGVLDPAEFIAFLSRATEVLGSSYEYETTLAHVAQLAVPEIADWCAVDIVQPDGSLRQITSGHPDPEQERLLLELRRRYREQKGGSEGVRHVIDTGESELASDVSAGPVVDLHLDAGESDVYRRLGPKSYIIVPLTVGANRIGALTFLSTREGRHYGAADLEFTRHLARRFALAVENARLHDQARRAHERLAFLASASELLNQSLDLDETLERLAFLAVPQAADWCGVELLQDDGSLRNVAVAHVDPAKIEFARELQERYPTDMGSPTGVPNVLRTGKSEMYAQIPDELLVEGAQDEEHLRIIRELGLVSVMIVPLASRDRTLGVISLVSSNLARQYGDEDLTFAEDLGRRAGAAIENARLYRRQEASARESKELLELLIRQAGEINDNIVQSLTIAKYAQASGEIDKASHSIDRTLEHARRIMEELQAGATPAPGDLRRRTAAT